MTKKFSFTKFEGMTEIGKGETVPMSAKLSIKALAVLQVIAMFQGVGGYCDTTQEQMAQMLNMSLRSVSEAIKELKSFTYEGKKVIEITTRKNPVTNKEQNVYILQPNKLFGVYGEKPTEELHAEIACNEQELNADIACNNTGLHAEFAYSKEEKITKEIILSNTETEEQSLKKVQHKPMGKKAIVDYFNSLLKDKGIESKFTYQSIYSVMKKQEIDNLLVGLKNNDIKRVCEIVSENYETWNNNTKFPLTVKVISWKWVWDRAIGLLKQEKESLSQMKEQSVEATKRQEIALSRIQSILNKKKKEDNANE